MLTGILTHPLASATSRELSSHCFYSISLSRVLLNSLADGGRQGSKQAGNRICSYTEDTLSVIRFAWCQPFVRLGSQKFKIRAFARFADRERQEDVSLCKVMLRAQSGAIQADLDGGEIKQCVVRRAAADPT